MRRYFLWMGLGLAAGLLLIAAITFARPYTLRGSAIQEPFPAPDFTLTDGSGQPYRLSDQRGKLLLIFFGFTYCPDVCPTTLADMKQIRERLGKDAEQVEFVFITVDPERDVPEKVGQYVAAFDSAFTGLSGDEGQLEPVWKAYGVYRNLNKESPDDKNYSVDHSSRVYLVDPSGNLRLTYTFGTPVDDILQDVRYLLKQKG